MKRSVVVALILAVMLVGGLVAYLVFLEGSRTQSDVAAAPRGAEQPRAAPAFVREPEVAAPAPEVSRAAVVDEQASEVKASEAATPALETTITGRFVDRAGLAVPAVRVNLRYPKFEAVADARGRFVLGLKTSFRTPTLELHASCEGYGNFERDIAVVEGQTTDLGDLMLAPSGTISGRVVDENSAPLAGAEVYATHVDLVARGPQFHGPWTSLAQGASDAKGNFRLTGVPAGAARVWAGGDERLWVSSEPLNVPEHGEIFDVVLTVRAVSPNDLIRLSVIDPTGAEVPEAELMFRYEAGNSSGQTTTQTDEHGRYTIHVEEHVTYTVQAFDPKRRFRASPAKPVAPGTLDLVLQLAENKSLAVIVREKQGGAPVESFRCALPAADGHTFDSRSTSPDEIHAGGRVELTLPMTAFNVRVDAAGYALEQLGPFDPDHAPAEVIVEVSLLPGVHGVVKAGGEPVAGATVSLHKEIERKQFYVVNGFAARYSDGGPEGRSDEHGAFSITLRDAGRYFLRAELEGWAAADSGPFAFDPNTGAKDLELELRRGGTVEGRAGTKVGEGAGGILIGASRGDGNGATVRTDADGKFRFTRLTPGRWWVGRHGEEIVPNSTSTTSGTRETDAPDIEWNCTVRDDATTWVDVPAPGEDPVQLDGKLAFGGKPAIGWQATLSKDGQDALRARAVDLDGEGRFHASCANPGECRLWFSDPARTGPALSISATTTLKLGGNRFELDIPVGVIEGSLSHELRSDAAKVSWVCALGESLIINGSLNLDPDGTFVLPIVPAGHIKFLRYTPGAGGVTLREVELAAGSKLRVDL